MDRFLALKYGMVSPAARPELLSPTYTKSRARLPETSTLTATPGPGSHASGRSPMSMLSVSPANMGSDWRAIFNQKPGECRWPLPPPSRKVQDCNFRFVSPTTIINDHVSIVTLPAGTELYHATSIVGYETKWFEDPRKMNKTPNNLMWFASSPEHAKHINYTHILKTKTKKDVQILFIQNITNAFSVHTGDQLMLVPKFRELVRTAGVHTEAAGGAGTAPELHIVGYAGCNECEIAFFRDKLIDIIDRFEVIETKSLAYFNGGTRKRRRSRTYKRKSRRN